MKITLTIVAMLVMVSSSHACDKQTIDFAQNFYYNALKFESASGESRIDVARAGARLVEAQYCAGQYSKQTFCANAAGFQYEILQNAKKRYDQHVGTAESLDNELKELMRIKILCRNG